tara:strand:- start:4213 stop:5310 length:1098 start_codon:yes stop_codon:yes gene_type:complete
MATLNTTNIKHASSSTNNIVLNADGSTTIPNLSVGPNRNVIINGEFQIAQRATQVGSITSGGYHTVDRWYTTLGTTGTWTQSRDTDVPAGTTFRNSLKMDCTTADSSLAAGDRLMLSYRIEGYDVQRFGKGTTSPKKFALSFWVKSPKTGTHIVELFDHDNSRHICKAYTISSANTWEQQKLVIDNETSNAFGNDNGRSFEIHFYLAAGSTYTSGTLATSWAANTNANRAVGQVNVADSTSNVFYLCGVQLEASDACTDFEHRSYGQELALCQRYCVVDVTSRNWYNGDGGNVYDYQLISWPTTMRATPTITYGSNVEMTNVNTSGGVNGHGSAYVSTSGWNYSPLSNATGNTTGRVNYTASCEL